MNHTRRERTIRAAQIMLKKKKKSKKSVSVLFFAQGRQAGSKTRREGKETSSQEDRSTRSEQILLSQSHSVSERRDPRSSVEVQEYVGSVGIEVDGFGRVRELGREVGGRSVGRGKGVEQLGRRVRSLSEGDVPDEGRPSSFGGDGVEELNEGKQKGRKTRQFSNPIERKGERKRRTNCWPLNGDHRERCRELEMVDDISEPGSDCRNASSRREVSSSSPRVNETKTSKRANSPNLNNDGLDTSTSPDTVLTTAVPSTLNHFPSLFPTLSSSAFIPTPHPAQALAPQSTNP